MKKLKRIYTAFLSASHKTHLLSIAGFAALLVIGAFVFEHGFGAAPCHLCWLARYGHWAILAAALGGMLLPEKARFGALAVVLLGAVYGLGLGIYHSLVQAKVIPGPSGCSGAPDFPADMASFQKFLENPTLPPRCDEVNFYLFGLSLPVWNIITMAFLMWIVYIVFMKRQKSRQKSKGE